MSFLDSLFKPRATGPEPALLYAALVAAARQPDWFRHGGVPDTIDGRFDMVAAMTALALIRLERDGPEGAAAATRLTEAFVSDMDGQLREQGIGDVVVGKHVGRMVSALGGRLAAYREALETRDDAALAAALERNLYRGAPPGETAVRHVAARLRAAANAMAALPLDRLLSGRIA